MLPDAEPLEEVLVDGELLEEVLADVEGEVDTDADAEEVAVPVTDGVSATAHPASSAATMKATWTTPSRVFRNGGGAFNGGIAHTIKLPRHSRAV